MTQAVGGTAGAEAGAQYVGLDVSMAKTAVCVVDAEGRRLWSGACASTPEALMATLRARAPNAARIGLETGPLAVWHWYALADAGFPVVCLHARHAKAALELQLNKTDPNDAHGLAQIVRTGWFRPVTLKSRESYRWRLLLAARARLVGTRTMLYNQIRGLVKTFGVVLPAGKGGHFAAAVAAALDGPLAGEATVRLVLASQLALWHTVDDLATRYARELERVARADPVCRRLQTVPGVGPLTAVTYRAAVDDPGRFGSSADVAAYLGLTPARYQSGAVDRKGGITKSGDVLARAMLYEAANALLTRKRRPTALQAWGRALAARAGHKKAVVALARKLAVVLFRVWRDGTVFNNAAAQAVS
jgi:transposase